MQICNDKSKNSSYICTHYCQCYLQIYVTSEKHRWFIGVFGHIKVHYGCYKTTKNGHLHIHTLLCFNNFPDPNTFIQALQDDEIFWQNMIIT